MITPGTAPLQNRETDTVSITVRIEGKDVTMDPGGLLSISVAQELNKIPWARISFMDGSVEKQQFEKSNNDVFAPGKSVEILLGYQQKQKTIFQGIIIRHAVKVQTGKAYKLEIECRDPGVKMTVVRKSHYFYKQNDKQVIQEILNLYPGLQAGKMEDTPTTHEQLVQYRATDWDFMLLRADASGKYLRLSNGSLDMVQPVIKPRPDLEIQFGMAASGIPILEFESALDARDHYPEVKGTIWDSTQQKLLDETANASGGGSSKQDFPNVLYDKKSPVSIYHPGDLDAQDLTGWTKAKLQRGQLSKVKGRASVNGVQVNPGDTLGVNGVGDRFNGSHIITGVLHQVVRGQWTTDIQFGWEREFFSEDRPADLEDTTELVAGIRGLHTGIVSKIEGDTVTGDHRIQVRLPYVALNPDNTQANGIYARLGCVYAGNKRGFEFRPELGDEVIVGFINGDPNDAVILGAVHSTANPGPSEIPHNDKNFKKGYIAKGGMQMIFDDDAKKIHLSTGGDNTPAIDMDGKGKKITITIDKDNSIELSATGVKINGTRIDLN